MSTPQVPQSSGAGLPITEENFEKEVENSRLPVILDFWAPWCEPCKAMNPILEELGSKFQTEVRVGKVNVDEQGALAAAFGIRSIPSLVLVKGGEIVHTEVGFGGRARLEALFDALSEG